MESLASLSPESIEEITNFNQPARLYLSITTLQMGLMDLHVQSRRFKIILFFDRENHASQI